MRPGFAIFLVVAIFVLGAWFGARLENEAPAQLAAVRPPDQAKLQPAAEAPTRPGIAVAPAQPPANVPPAGHREPVRRDIRDVTPDHVLPGPRIDGPMVTRLPAVVAPKPQPRRRASWMRTVVLSPGSVQSGDRAIFFAGIEALDARATCTAADGSRWQCGNFARAALRRLIRRRPIDCEATAAAEGERQDRLAAHCRIDGRDIGEWLVAQGWATPLPGSGYEAALEAARKAQAGQWRRDNPERGLPATIVLEPAVEQPMPGQPGDGPDQGL